MAAGVFLIAARFPCQLLDRRSGSHIRSLDSDGVADVEPAIPDGETRAPRDIFVGLRIRASDLTLELAGIFRERAFRLLRARLTMLLGHLLFGDRLFAFPRAPFTRLLFHEMGGRNFFMFLAHIIHDGSSRNREVATRDGRVELRGREAYLKQYVDRPSGGPARLAV